jgi:hypothetical protein
MAVYADSLDLRTHVIEQIGQEGITDVWPRIVQLAELNINRESRHRRQITGTTLTFTAGVATLPTDFLEALHLYGTNKREMFEAPLSVVKESGSQYGYYAIDGSSIVVYGYDGTKDFEYFAVVPTISAALSDTSWVLSSYPDVYFAACLLEAAKHTKDIEAASIAERLFDMAMDKMRIDSDRQRFGRGVVRPNGVKP